VTALLASCDAVADRRQRAVPKPLASVLLHGSYSSNSAMI
jgi:hypothetical protein